MNRNDDGIVLIELVVVMAISGLLLAGVLSTMYLSVKLVNTAPADTNPHTFGAVAATVARLEGSATADLTCTNPSSGVNSRKDCVKITSDPQTPTSTADALCWVVNTDTGRRRECWELLPQGDLVAHRYRPVAAATAEQCYTPPTTSTATDPARPAHFEDCLAFDDTDPVTVDDVQRPDWQTTPAESLPRAAGLKALEWACLTPAEVADPTLVVPPDSCTRSFADGPARVELASCAAIRPDQRQLMADDAVPFCDGTTGTMLPDGSDRPSHDPNDWSTIEGYPMPTLRVFS